MSNLANRTIVVVFPRLGPYHVARMEAVNHNARLMDSRLVCIEVSGFCRYEWDVYNKNTEFERITLFPKRAYKTLSRSEVRNAMWEALNAIRPTVTALPGWAYAESMAALRWCLDNDCSVICMSDSKKDDVPRLWWKEWVKRKRVRRFDFALVAGKPHADYARELGFATNCIVDGYDVVDNCYFATETLKVREQEARWRSELDLPSRFFLLMTRFIEKKNLHRLLKAYAVYRKRTTAPWDLVMAGSGELEPELRELAAQLQLTGVIWPGFIQYPDQPRYYGLASAFVLPSTTEQWGLVVNEAMASGLPVLVSKTAGCRYDLVEEGKNGFLYDPFRIEEIADAMFRISSLSAIERTMMGQQSRKIIAEWGLQRFTKSLWKAVDWCERLRVK